ncbi:methyl-accepting chemotaxis protein [Azoarcus sp. PA01]|nr:methyl-accepting chemotaxis protein [Azoarcus sp. PA01]
MALKLPKLDFTIARTAYVEDAPAATTIMEAPLHRAAPKERKARPQKRPRTASEKIALLGMAFALTTIAGLGLIFHQFRESANATSYISVAGEMETLSQRIAKAAQLSLQGNPQAFVDLRSGTSRFAELLDTLDQGGSIAGREIPPAPAVAQAGIAALHAAWSETERNAARLLGQEKTLLTLTDAITTLNEEDEQLFQQARQLAQVKLQTNTSGADIAAASTVVMLTQRITKNANALLAPNAVEPQTAAALAQDARALVELVATLAQATTDPAARARLQGFEAHAQGTLAAVNRIVDNIDVLVRAKQAGRYIFYRDSEALTTHVRALSATFDESVRGLTPATLGIALVALLGLAILGLMAKINNAEIAARGAEAEALRKNAEDEHNLAQQAILRLMNEMGELADGDLTVRTTVSEDITGAIADSVNYTIEELSVLVRRINDAAGRVTAATESAQRTSTELLDATGRQSREIQEAGAAVQQMARSMSESSELALRSAQVARRSLDSARKGAGAVENTIRGMNDIRGQIQDTSKRIKRLGESSQEIGEIVELISDITEQTNVLALNAAIQAASAGEAGRGFTVVAEEVQRLAERSGEATKQIAAIVKTIQTDTKDAVGSMETATRDVVEGAQLSDAAGQALAEIGDVSTETARLIEQISGDTQQQAAAATRVADAMKEILAVTEQTARGTQQTAVSVGQLADLAVELKGSVSGFKV